MESSKARVHGPAYFAAVCALSTVMLRKYSGMQGFPMLSVVSQHNMDAEIVGHMNKIVAFITEMIFDCFSH